jgi:hypothetical protein
MSNSDKRYLWLNFSDQKSQNKYIYLNENDELITGNSVNDSCIDSPYPCNSVHMAAVCVGEAKKYIRTIYPKNNFENWKI